MNIKIKNHKERIDYNLQILSSGDFIKNKYKHLYKILNPRSPYLNNFLMYCNRKGSMPARDKQYHFAACRYLSKEYGGSYTTWNKNINIFTLLGLVVKYKVAHRREIQSKEPAIQKREKNNIPISKMYPKIGLLLPEGMAASKARRFKRDTAKQKGIDVSKVLPIGFYSIPKYTEQVLWEADSIAKTMKAKGFTAASFSKIWIIKAFGQEKADSVFNDRRTVTNYSDYVANEISKFILKEIECKKYTTKEQVIKGVRINWKDYQGNLTCDYGFIDQDKPQAIIKREFERSIIEITEAYNLEYRKAKKTDIENLNLKGYIWIVCSK